MCARTNFTQRKSIKKLKEYISKQIKRLSTKNHEMFWKIAKNMS